MPTLKLRSHVPVASEASHTAMPAKGPSWLVAPTKHADERVGYDDDTISIPHFESGRLFPYFRETIRGSELGGLEAIDQRLATAAAHYAAGEEAFGSAIADLCVTGRESFRQLGPRNVDDPVDWPRVEAAVRSAAVLPETKTRRMIEGRAPLPPPGHDHVKRAIERAQKVHAYLRASEKERTLLRPGLGWVAVSGEDDLPLRPVNVSVTNHPQRDVTLRVWGLEVPLRYVLASTPTATSKNVLLLHGHSSRIEEVEQVITGLTSEGYVVLALDLPTNGYSGQLDHKHVLFAEEPVRAIPLPYAKEPRRTDKHSSLYTLRFLIETIHVLVQHVFAQHNLPPRIDLVGGGSLGGNLGLLLSALAPWGQPQRHAWVDPRLSWIQRVSSWSPACLWNQPNIAAGEPHKRSYEGEDEDRRRDHLNRWMNVDHVWVVVIRQAEQWYRRGWPDKPRALAESWLARHETYSPRFRRWHWIVAHEQVKFSHQDPVIASNGQTTTTPGWGLVGGKLLLMAGAGDNFSNTNIADRVSELGPKMCAHGHALVWKDTGHSIHDERPNELVAVLDRFAKDAL
jgi:pimeloyl-ACP methyl ester carboxylesterase